MNKEVIKMIVGSDNCERQAEEDSQFTIEISLFGIF
jgi:hypothetical protein